MEPVGIPFCKLVDMTLLGRRNNFEPPFAWVLDDKLEEGLEEDRMSQHQLEEHHKSRERLGEIHMSRRHRQVRPEEHHRNLVEVGHKLLRILFRNQFRTFVH